ncbi:MAG TPA: DNA primase [Candidatus Omnitrophica bacterium]|nr:MAG: DNA primase [Omnitrophica WOR_2 bacterium GWA2_45_18]OGX19971.1 MAG: DNA primase [Omnitrophica WOR_2 bacterium GWC2_45_7]HBR14757.1 DNA primase [Candidatus Omnitrophota bacterium]
MAFISEEIIAQVIERSDIVEMIASYIPLKRAGRNFKANCPFHNEKTPSFVVNPEKQIFHCFGCGVGGNVLTFVMKQERLEFPEVVRMLAEKVNVPIPGDTAQEGVTRNLRQTIFQINELAVEYFHKLLLSGKDEDSKNATKYLKQRGVDLEAVNKFRLGLAANQWDGLIKYLRSKDISLSLMEKAGLIIPRENAQGYYDRFRYRIIYPIFDTRGQCRAFGARLIELPGGNQDKHSAKYLNSPETIVYTKGQHLYGFHLAKQAIMDEDCVVIVEGYMDCLMPHQAGVTHVVASLGTALTVEQIRLLRHYTKNVIMLFDADKAGESATLRSLDVLVEEEMHVRIATLDEGEDPDSFIRRHGGEAFRDRLLKAQTLFDYKINRLLKTWDVKSIEGKARIASEMIATIDKFNNEIIRTEYLKRLAQVLLIPEHALVVELRKVQQNTAQRQEKKAGREIETRQAQNPSSQEHLRSVERSILRLLLKEGDFIPMTKEEIAPSDFQDSRIREVISKMYDLFEKGKKIDSAHLINCFHDQGMQQMISALVAEEEPLIGDKIKIHRDYLNRIKNDRLKLLRQDLMRQMREAEISGDHPRLEKLKNEFHQSVNKK